MHPRVHLVLTNLPDHFCGRYVLETVLYDLLQHRVFRYPTRARYHQETIQDVEKREAFVCAICFVLELY
jgi:hypothetical protein